MSTDIYARPDFTKKVRYNRGDQEERGEREERMVEIYESADTLRDQQPEGGSHTQTYLPAVQRSRNPFRAAAVSLGLLGLLLGTGIIVLSIYYISVIVDRRNLLTSHHNLTQERNQLLTSHHNLTQERNQLQTEVNQLKSKIEGKWCPEGWEIFGGRCYYKSTEKKTWTESRKDCQKTGSDLVVINSREEQEFVSKLNQDGASWIGLRYTARWKWKWEWEWEWEWVDGSPLTPTYWAAGEPQSPSHRPYVSCCNHQGRWTQVWYYDSKFWIYVYARPDFTKKVRYNRRDQEERGEREERMVEIYESADTLRDQQPEGGSHTQTYLPAVQRSRNPFRAAAVSLGLLGLLLGTGIIVLSIYYIYARPDFTKKVRYNRGDQEERGEREERMVEIYESADTLRDQQPEGGSHTQTYLPAVQRSRNPFRAAAVSLGLLGLLLGTGIIVLSIYYISVIVDRHNLLTSHHNLTQERNQLLTSHHNLTQERNQLLTSHHNLTEEKKLLQIEVNQLKSKIEGICQKAESGWSFLDWSALYSEMDVEVGVGVGVGGRITADTNVLGSRRASKPQFQTLRIVLQSPRTVDTRLEL
ncbi:uncharacterized protein [Centroberyx affinis]|uniref:uncharacterized protein n=1 Tax=Centroberyx affinis TaxID=166261 RepID=UPI003A5C2BD2